MMIHTVRGHFGRFEADVYYDEARPERTTVEARIEAATINTNLERRDDHLRSADFLDAENHPYLVFKSKGVEIQDDRHGRLIGDLTIRGVTREVALDVELAGVIRSPWGHRAVGFSATTRIDRRDWGLTWNQVIEGASVLVGDTVTIGIDLELVEEAQPAAEMAVVS
jgi:polyisoprenoid-binding protein YceI